jgi:hypothetical protein
MDLKYSRENFEYSIKHNYEKVKPCEKNYHPINFEASLVSPPQKLQGFGTGSYKNSIL